ncbi:DUF4259 domain-containing protein [Pseudoxanthomonas sp. UC19_8]|uniref:DUF4259 domain-containing protein n=1 Tax=Pseudoxanthomonas sp. UC19_8 TaxID=3350175 RepID=UPI0036D4197B
MGAWGLGSFENDEAADLVLDALERNDLSVLQDALEAVLTTSGEIEASDACRAIAATEMLAAILGEPAEAAQEQDGVMDWVARVDQFPDERLVAKGRLALQKILGPDSELCDLWRESGDLEAWMAEVVKIESRLRVK